jgi:hypothetical protein
MQVTTDNAPVNLRAWTLISDKYPHIFLSRVRGTRIEFVTEGLGKSKVD